MKKITLSFLALLSIAIVYSSCSEDEKEPTPSGPQYGEVSSFGTVVLKGRNNPSSLAGLSFLDASTGSTFTIDSATEVQNKVDMVYYFGSTSGDSTTIASPNATVFANPITSDNPWEQLLAWTVKNDTKFKVITDSVTHTEVDDALNDSLILKYANNLTSSSITKLELDDIVVFKTATGKKGIYVVESIDGTNALSRSVTIAVKIQK